MGLPANRNPPATATVLLVCGNYTDTSFILCIIAPLLLNEGVVSLLAVFLIACVGGESH